MSGGYRPYPPPRGPWVMTQTWEDLVFAHWPVEVAALRRVVPASLPLDTYDGRAWLGVVPFHLRRIAPRGLPWGLGFPELNVRTYVTVGDEPGIYFFSLDAANPLAVVGARLAYHLPYFHARMSIRRDGAWIRYASRRVHGGAPPAALRARYRPTGPAAVPPPG
ncbi:MAG: DUF2071 domain-containing protein, partial [Thermomicrobiaceae bacterium]|nr:DUF2071 domain-containing protein [Thermomicrobiaceae bacterium]